MNKKWIIVYVVFVVIVASIASGLAGYTQGLAHQTVTATITSVPNATGKLAPEADIKNLESAAPSTQETQLEKLRRLKLAYEAAQREQLRSFSDLYDYEKELGLRNN